MDERELDELYISWLYDQVGAGGSNPNHTYWELLSQLYHKEFIWIIPNDDNRVEDGRELRFEFVREQGFAWVKASWMGIGCSFLEMLVGLSRRLAFEAEGEVHEWFWHLLGNLKIATCVDSVYRISRKPEQINEIMDMVIWRTYSSSGAGGLFPLRYPDQDQRGVEIWYQLNAYLMEQEEMSV